VTGRVLVAGVGNIFQRDDGFGVEVARRLAERPWPEHVKVADFGIRGVHLAYELLDGYDTLILVDTVAGGDEPGTVSVIEPRRAGAGPARPGGEGTLAAVDAHGMHPEAVLAMVDDLGGRIGRVLVVGCRPADVGDGIGLTPPVVAAVDVAVRAVAELVEPVEPLESGAVAAPDRKEP
jgi:hydrogenase maturation protease